MCHLTMQNKLAVDPEYQKMASKDGATLYRLISKILNEFSTVQNLIQQSVDVLFNFVYIRGGDYDLQQFYKAFHNRRKNAEKLSCFFSSETLRDLVMEGCVTRKDTGSDLFNLLFEWKKATSNRSGVIDNNNWDERNLKISTG